MNERIYVIEDDENIKEILTIGLSSNGYQVTTFDHAKVAIEEIQKNPPDLAIFDIMLPEMDGLTAIKVIRDKDITIPILILSAKDSEIDKVHGLDSGSDDYMTKPFSILELFARVRSLLRRNSRKQVVIKTNTLEINTQTRSVMKDNTVLDLTKKEYQILVYIIHNHHRIVEREELFLEVWGYDFEGESRAMDVAMRSLRNKLNDDGETYIKTIRGVGYRFIEECVMLYE